MKYSELKDKKAFIAIIYVILALAVLGWGSLIVALSSENGEKTAQTSRRISEAIVRLFTDEPAPEAVGIVDRYVRTTAHFILFFVLGILLYATLYGLRIWLNRYLIGLGAMLSLGGFAYWDEWRKQLIEGRHFQLEEAALNLAGGACGILTLAVALHMLRVWLEKRSRKKALAAGRERS